MSRKAQIIIGMLLIIIVGAVFYFAFFKARRIPKQAVVATSAREQSFLTERHLLSGELIEDKEDFFVISVMYDNISESATRPGLESAHVVYEALVEGGITRIMALFDSRQKVERFGPIRSARPYFIDWAAEYGGALMHVGGSLDALQLLQQIDLVNVNEMSSQGVYFTRDASLPAPHNVFSQYSSWLKFGEHINIQPARFISWKFDETEVDEAEKQDQQIEIEYRTDNEVAWVFNKDYNTYVRYLNGDRIYFSTGGQISTSNVIVVEVASTVIDEVGRLRLETIGTGEALIYTRGQEKIARWIKNSRIGRMRFVDEDQGEVVLTPGTTWIEVVPDLDIVTYQTFDSGS